MEQVTIFFEQKIKAVLSERPSVYNKYQTYYFFFSLTRAALPCLPLK